MADDSTNRTMRSLMASIGALAVCVFLWPAVFSFDTGDWPSPSQYPNHSPVANACGVLGAWCAYQLRHYLGLGAYPLLLFATVAACVRLARGGIDHFWGRLFGVVLVVLCAAAAARSVLSPGITSLPVGPGGVVGFALGDLLQQNLDRVGTGIVVVSSLLVGLLFATEGWILKLPGSVVRGVQAAASAFVFLRRVPAAARLLHRSPAREGVTVQETAALLGVPQPGREAGGIQASRATQNDSSRPLLFAGDVESSAETVDDDGGVVAGSDQDTNAIPVGASSQAMADEQCKDGGDGDPSRGIANARSAKTAKSPTTPIVRFASPAAAALEPYPRQIENWKLPSLSLLRTPDYGLTTQQEQFVRRQAQVLEQTLEEFRLDARVVEIDTGPVITMFELKLGAGIKVSQIATLSNDIARALKAHAIRVVAPISGKNTVGVEVPNTKKETVRLRELMMLAGKRATDMRLPLFLGKDAGGEPLVADLTRMPHLLIAGTTGSGKSVCLNAMILSVLMTQRPDHVKMIVIDPKMVEMSQFKDVPHLMCPIVTDLVRAEKILEWAVTKMDERYELLAEARVKNVAAFNQLGPDEIYARLQPETEQERARIPTRIPYIVIIIDELADLMMTAAKEVEHHLSRLAQKSRAVGVHIIVATQRPEARVVTGLIKSNLPCRISFRVASRMDSRIVLDQNGGEVLLGQGDMLFLPPGSHRLVRAQGTFLDEAEVQAVLSDLAARAKPEFHPELVRLRTPGGEVTDGLRDPLFDDAVGVILESQRGSVSLLQRRLMIGYSRASRLIDQMAAAGIVGEYRGSQAREVNMTLEQWEALRAETAAERKAGYAADEDTDDESDADFRNDETPDPTAKVVSRF